ncbi:MAG: hypothetical protein JOZ98_06590 [Solirubrobacterales bacterium]|nr:hypothetical protein [Solirubrobacterales bacterium]
MDGLVPTVLRSVGTLEDALEAECWASELVSMWRGRQLIDGEAEEVFVPAFIRALERKGSPKALATLRALSAVGRESHARKARAAADGLAGRGVSEPPWAAQLGHAEPVATELTYEEAFDDGVSVLIEFAPPDGERHTLGIYIDHNLGGLVKDAFLAGPLDEVRSKLSSQAHNGVGLALRKLEPAEARARIEAGLYMLDHTYDAPVDDDVHALRGLIDGRIRRLPDGFELPEEYEEMSVEERERLHAEFLASPEGQHWRGDAGAEDVVETAIWFGADYNHGGPLRWSVVVVEIFMTSWLPRKVTREPVFFERVTEVLPDWVRYAGRVRGVPAEPLSEASQAVELFQDEMLEAVNDPHAWGPAKTFAVAAQAAGVDLTDPDALNAFVEKYNEGLAA